MRSAEACRRDSTSRLSTPGVIGVVPSLVHPAKIMISGTKTAAIGEGSFVPATMVLFRTIVLNDFSVVNSKLYHAFVNCDALPGASPLAEKSYKIGPNSVEMSARRTDWR